MANETEYMRVRGSLLASRSHLAKAVSHPNVEIVEQLLIEAAIATKDYELLQIEQQLANERFSSEMMQR